MVEKVLDPDDKREELNTGIYGGEIAVNAINTSSEVKTSIFILILKLFIFTFFGIYKDTHWILKPPNE